MTLDQPTLSIRLGTTQQLRGMLLVKDTTVALVEKLGGYRVIRGFPSLASLAIAEGESVALVYSPKYDLGKYRGDSERYGILRLELVTLMDAKNPDDGLDRMAQHAERVIGGLLLSEFNGGPVVLRFADDVVVQEVRGESPEVEGMDLFGVRVTAPVEYR